MCCAGGSTSSGPVIREAEADLMDLRLSSPIAWGDRDARDALGALPSL